MCIKAWKKKIMNQLTYFREDFDIIFKWIKQNKWKTFIGFFILILIAIIFFGEKFWSKIFKSTR
jgi:hypothetical protein